MTIRLLIFLALMASACYGQADNRYYVRDDIKTDKLDYTIEHDCVVFSWGADKGELPCLQYHKHLWVNGCKQESFTYDEQDYNESFSFKDYYELAKIFKKADLLKLNLSSSPSCQFIFLTIDGQDHHFTTSLENPARADLQKSILSFLDRVAPRERRTTVVHTIESDFAPAQVVTIQQLLSTPAVYDGKRVRVTGYYHGEGGEEPSSDFSQNKEDSEKKTLWLYGGSTFANDADIHWVDDGHITVEGTFYNGPSGDWGMFPGAIERLTKLISLDPPPPPPPPANQSSKRNPQGPSSSRS